MSRVPMIATMRQTFDGRAVKSGDPIEAASESDADDMEAVRSAQRVTPKNKLRAPAVITRVMSSEQKTTEPEESSEEKPDATAPAITASTATPTRQASTKGSAYNRSDVRASR